MLTGHGLELRVEGHSDDQPIHNAQFSSNWELSTARAMAVLLYLVNSAGFDPTKISASGYGQYRSVADNATAEGRRMNRRVDLVVLPQGRRLDSHADRWLPTSIDPFAGFSRMGRKAQTSTNVIKRPETWQLVETLRRGLSGLKEWVKLRAPTHHDTMTPVVLSISHCCFAVGAGVSMRGSNSARVAAL